MAEWVFLTPHGHRLTTEVLQKAFYACLDGADIRRVRFHDCRTPTPAFSFSKVPT